LATPLGLAGAPDEVAGGADAVDGDGLADEPQAATRRAVTAARANAA
jgi:hypothetical protein